MKIHINANAKKSDNNGILEEHFAGFSKTAQEENVVIIVRPVNPITKVLLPLKYPTKHFSIKNKSSDWGVQSGFIVSLPELSFLSKTGFKVNETQATFIMTLCKNFSIKLDKNNIANNKIKLSSLQLKENETILTLTVKHFQYLVTIKEKIGISEYKYAVDNNVFVKCFQPKNEKKEVIFYLEKAKNDNFEVYYTFAFDERDQLKELNNKSLQEIIVTEKNNLIYFPIPIFCKKINEEKKPFIPDYDLFAVCWIIDESIKYHQPQIPTNSFAAMKTSSCMINENDKTDFKQIFKKPYIRRKKINIEQDEKIGNVLVNKMFLDKINKNLGYEKGIDDQLRPIHHDFELINTNPNNFNENIYTVFLPNSNLITDFDFPQETTVKNKKNIFYFLIESESTIQNNIWKIFLEPFFLHLQKKGYYVPNNCFVEKSNYLGFANSFNPWVKKIRNEKTKAVLETVDEENEKMKTDLENANEENEKLKEERQKQKQQFTKKDSGYASDYSVNSFF